ncbi:hypothetical protein BIW11_03096 [Tropilaelaps mercedesae]|uniref:Uncharacterized protein n=1 Tax=Tropilaelaps mercedesae TaxID=418985 RepID=A0A1V9XSB1_9ACAR|nr:hypothetical protein BIW11_03096 [Tropilaelaps mercedesae]
MGGVLRSTYEQIEHLEQTYEVVREGNDQPTNPGRLSVAAAIQFWGGSKSSASLTNIAGSDAHANRKRTDAGGGCGGRAPKRTPSDVGHLTPQPGIRNIGTLTGQPVRVVLLLGLLTLDSAKSSGNCGEMDAPNGS